MSSEKHVASLSPEEARVRAFSDGEELLRKFWHVLNNPAAYRDEVVRAELRRAVMETLACYDMSRGPKIQPLASEPTAQDNYSQADLDAHTDLVEHILKGLKTGNYDYVRKSYDDLAGTEPRGEHHAGGKEALALITYIVEAVEEAYSRSEDVSVLVVWGEERE